MWEINALDFMGVGEQKFSLRLQRGYFFKLEQPDILKNINNKVRV